MRHKFLRLYDRYKRFPTERKRDALYRLSMDMLDEIHESILNPF